MEVILALTLFVAAASVITSGLNASVHEVERLRLNLHANNLAVSLMSELQMGLKAIESSSPTPFDPPYAEWTWQIQATPAGDSPESAVRLQTVEVIVRHQTQPVVCRLVQYLPSSIPVISGDNTQPFQAPVDASSRQTSGKGEY